MPKHLNVVDLDTRRIEEKLEVTTIDNFFENSDNQETAETFLEIVNLRKKGFLDNYPKTFLPLDALDFVSRHQVVRFENTPIACYKHVQLSICNKYQIDFPFAHYLDPKFDLNHSAAMQKIISTANENNNEILYGGGLTVSRDYRKNKTLSKFVKDLIAGLLYFDFFDLKASSIVTISNLDVSVSHLFEKLGFQPMTYNEIELPQTKIARTDGKPAKALILESMSEWAKECFEKNESLITSRKTIEQKTKLIA